MKTLISSFAVTMLASLFSIAPQTSHAQIWKKIKQEVKNRVESKAVNTAGNTADKVMDKTVDGISNKEEKTEAPQEEGQQPADKKVRGRSLSDYKSYDFVAGDKIIFSPDLSTEADAELPARFTIIEGNAEIQSYEGEKILHTNKGGSVIVAPMMTNRSYLPNQFTVEFDFMYENSADYFQYVSDFGLQFRKVEDDNFKNFPLYAFSMSTNSGCVWGVHGTKIQHFPEALQKSLNDNGWHHAAIYVRDNIGKAYIDAYRVAASNTIPRGAGHLAIFADPHYGVKIKNFRVAAGGDDKYNKIVTDGKFITHGILFDVNQSTIKPESMGALNQIAKLMKDHSDLKFEIDGHTDSDGNDEANKKLSQQRADAVKAGLIEMGIDASRLTTKGFGETRPIDKNDSAEGKANNRRVEFIKQ